jgi:hypothetical protein
MAVERFGQLVGGPRDRLPEEAEPLVDRGFDGSVEGVGITRRHTQQVARGDVGADLGRPELGGDGPQVGHGEDGPAHVHSSQQDHSLSTGPACQTTPRPAGASLQYLTNLAYDDILV